MSNKKNEKINHKELYEDFEEILHDFKRVEDAIRPILKKYMDIRRQHYLEETGIDIYELTSDKEFQQMLTIIGFDYIEENLENQLTTERILKKFFMNMQDIAELVEAKNNTIIVTYYKLFNDILAIDDETADIESMNQKIIDYYPN